MKFAAVALMSVTLTGCVAAWGQSYKIEFASSTSITINYDPAFTNIGALQSVAQENCDKYKKDALPQASASAGWGLRTISFLCVNRS